MDERAEETRELHELERDDRDDARQTREEWAQSEELSAGQFVFMETEAWSR